MKNNKLHKLAIVGLVSLFVALSVIAFFGLSYLFGVGYAVKTIVKSYAIVAVVEVIIILIEKLIKKKKDNKGE